MFRLGIQHPRFLLLSTGIFEKTATFDGEKSDVRGIGTQYDKLLLLSLLSDFSKKKKKLFITFNNHRWYSVWSLVQLGTMQIMFTTTNEILCSDTFTWRKMYHWTKSAVWRADVSWKVFSRWRRYDVKYFYYYLDISINR